MKSKADTPGVSRRGFLRTATAAGVAAGAMVPGSAKARANADQSTTTGAAPPSDAQRAMETEIPEGYTADQAKDYFVSRPGSDFMVDALRSLDIDYVAMNAGSSFRGLHESIISHGGNSRPEILTCLHEEQAAAIAHGYAKIAGKPMAVACHGTVGIQHAAMAVYNAWCDRVPMIVIGGNHVEATERNSFVTWAHSAQDAVSPIRDFTKWDDTPASAQHFSESLVRSYKIATTPPMGPVAIIADGRLQEEDVETPPKIPRLAPTRRPAGDANAVREAARLLVAAEAPVIFADLLAHSQDGMDRLVELAETLQAPVVDQGGRMNFPNDHYLNHTFLRRSVTARADVILGLELNDTWGAVNRSRDRVRRQEEMLKQPDAKVISIGVGDLYLKSNYQDFQRYYPSDLSIAGDGQITLPSLIDAVRREMSNSRKAVIAAREDDLRAAHEKMRAQSIEAARYAWDATPVSTARLCMELWRQIKDKDWALTSWTGFQLYWPQRLWRFDKHYQYLGNSGGYGIGYGCPASVGAALAHRRHDRLVVNIQSDGDLMYTSGALWTAAHHKIPLLSVMHNNGGYHQELMHLQRMASRRQRGTSGGATEEGNVFKNPSIDFATLAKSMGVWSTGPITDPNDLAPALSKAIDVVERGEPALVDVVCQPR